jgi:RNA polymerase sigma-70 factor (ECF subfamily)
MTSTEKIWKEYHDNLRRFIQMRVSDKSVADDVLQEVFVKIHSGLNTLKDDARLQSWLYQVTRNTIVDYYRSPRPTEELPENVYFSETEDGKVLSELAHCMRPMIDVLPEPYRQAIILSEIEGLTQKQISERLGLSLSGAKSRVQRGRLKLKEMLLDCCHFEFDRRGGVVEFNPKRGRGNKC